MTCLAGEQIVYDGKSVVLEEYCFSKAGDFQKSGLPNCPDSWRMRFSLDRPNALC